jgi:hypothetical protein
LADCGRDGGNGFGDFVNIVVFFDVPVGDFLLADGTVHEVDFVVDFTAHEVPLFGFRRSFLRFG